MLAQSIERLAVRFGGDHAAGFSIEHAARVILEHAERGTDPASTAARAIARASLRLASGEPPGSALTIARSRAAAVDDRNLRAELTAAVSAVEQIAQWLTPLKNDGRDLERRARALARTLGVRVRNRGLDAAAAALFRAARRHNADGILAVADAVFSVARGTQVNVAHARDSARTIVDPVARAVALATVDALNAG